MRPLRIHAENFGSYPTLDLDLAGVSLAAIVGENGAGKSTLLDAIRVGLYGSAVRSLDSFVRQNADGFMLTFDFAARGETYRVVREHGAKRGQKATLFRMEAVHESGIEWRPIGESGPRNVDPAIVALLGADYATFCLTQHIPQGALTAFPALDASERGGWVRGKVPGLRVYDGLEAKAKEELKTLDCAILSAEAKRDAKADQRSEDVPDLALLLDTVGCEAITMHTAASTLEEGLRQVGAQASVREEFVAATGRRGAAEQALTRATEQASRDSAEVDRLKVLVDAAPATPPAGDKDALIAERTELDELISTAEKVAAAREAKTNAATVELTRATVALTAAESRKTPLIDAHQQAVRTYDLALDAKNAYGGPATACPYCGADPEHQDSKAVIASLDKAVADADARVQKLDDEVAATAVDIDELTQRAKDAKAELATLTEPLADDTGLARDRRGDINSTLDALAAAEVAQARAKDAREALARATAQWQDSTSAEVKAREEAFVAAIACTAAEEAAAGLPTIDIAALTLASSDAAAAHERAKAALADAERTIATQDRLEDDITMLTNAIVDLTTQQHNLTLLAKAYGRNGIQARLVEEAVAAIEDHANSFLSKFTDGLQVELRTTRENKTGGKRETLDILVTDSLGTRPIESFSGGETTRVCFALAAGLAGFVQSATDSSAESFAVDEPEYLDAAGVAELVRCLHVIAQDVPMVLLISHIDGVSETLPQKIVVSKDSAGSHAEVVLG